MTSAPTPRDETSAEWYCATCDRSFGDGTTTCPHDGTRLVRIADGDPLIGRTIDGRFVVRERLGQGGMGVVYRAWQASIGRDVAVKVIRPRPGHDGATAKRFLREAKLASQLSQPSTVSVFDFGQTDDGTLYLVMELVRGRTLADELRAHGRLSPARAVRIGVQLCDALEAAHRLGIIHRDLKPANVMILDDPPGRDLVKVLDFGLAKATDTDESTVTQSGRMVGTPSHLSPEVAMGAVATSSSDLYAVGVLLFEMLDGRLPFVSDSVNLMVAMHAYQAAPALGPHVPRGLARAVAATLAKEPSARPASAAALRGWIEAALDDDDGPDAVATTDLGAPTASMDRPSLPTPRDRSDAAMAETLPKPKTRPPLVAERAALASAQAERPAAAIEPAVTTSAPSTPSRRGWLFIAAALAVAIAVVVLIALASGGEDHRGRAAATIDAATPFDAAATPVLATPIDAAATVIDAGVIDDAPLADADAAPRDRDRDRDASRRQRPDAGATRAASSPIDAGSARPPVDAAPPPPPPIDAAPHPWD